MHRYIDELRLLQAIRLAVLATDRSGTVTFVNRAATEVFSAVDPELVGHQRAGPDRARRRRRFAGSGRGDRR